MSQNLLAWQIALDSLNRMLANKNLTKPIASKVGVEFFECQFGQIALETPRPKRPVTGAKLWLTFKPEIQQTSKLEKIEKTKGRYNKLNATNGSKLGKGFSAWTILIKDTEINKKVLIDKVIAAIAGEKILSTPVRSELPNQNIENNPKALESRRTISHEIDNENGGIQATIDSLDSDTYDLELLEDIAAIEEDDVESPTEKQELRDARRGQGKFRKNTTAIWGGDEKCAVTGLQIPALLNASHIKPWRDCDSKREKLSGCNGILLCVHLDRLFDRYLIGFEKTSMSSPRVRSLICSPKLKSKFSLLGIIGITGSLNLDLTMIEGSNLVELEKNLDIHLAKVQLEI